MRSSRWLGMAQQAINRVGDGLWVAIRDVAEFIWIAKDCFCVLVLMVVLEKGAPTYWPEHVSEAVDVQVIYPCGHWRGVAAFLEQRGADGVCGVVGFASYVARNAEAVAQDEAKKKGYDGPARVYVHWLFPYVVYLVAGALVVLCLPARRSAVKEVA